MSDWKEVLRWGDSMTSNSYDVDEYYLEGRLWRVLAYGKLAALFLAAVLVAATLVLLLVGHPVFAPVRQAFGLSPEPAAVAIPVAKAEPTTSAKPPVEESAEIQRALAPLRDALEDPGQSILRINALIKVAQALDKFASVGGGYPNTEAKMVAIASVQDVFRRREIEAAVPETAARQMRYISDGKSYKLIVTAAGDCAVVRALRPAMVDPRRAFGKLDCLAYGFWTPAGRDY